MIFKVISSSSNGNAYILKSPTGTLIIECGVNYKKILEGLDFKLEGVVGVLVSHQHLDHSKSMRKLMENGIDVYSNPVTFQALNLSGHRVNAVEPLEQFMVGDFEIIGFPIEHDAEGLGYLIQYRPTGYKLLFLTDTFYSKYRFKELNAIAIECNYIKETLDQNIADGLIHAEMKPRLLKSHMSLENLKMFLKANDLSRCQEIILLHLSGANSNSKQMINELKQLTGIVPKIAEPGLSVNLELYPY